MSNNLAEWRRIRIECGAMWDEAKARGDKAAMEKADDLMHRADQIMAKQALEGYESVARELAKIAALIEKATSTAKEWSPFQDIAAELRSYRGDVPDNDDLDEGPTPPDGLPPEKPVDPARIPVVPVGWSENYQALWDTMTISSAWQERATNVITQLVQNQVRYATVVEGTPIPWWFVGIVHNMEGGMKFTTHLHNGDPLTGRTKNKPANRPVVPAPPYTWEYSARDSLEYKNLPKLTDWSLPSVLYQWHRYNGIVNEYKRRGIPTPYLWSGCQHYVKGKYVRDGEFDPTAISGQVGAAVVLRMMVQTNVVKLPTAAGSITSNPRAAAGDPRVLDIAVKDWPQSVKDELKTPVGVTFGAKDTGKQLRVRRFQEWLTVANFETPVDGDFGESTKEQFRKFKVANGRAPDADLSEELWSILTAPMLRALAPIGAESSISLEEAVVRVAEQHIAQQPRELGGNNRGAWVRMYMEGQQDLRWCAGFVCFIVYQAAKELGLNMPFPRQVGVDELVRDAKNEGRFIKEGSLTSPAARRSKILPGTLFVVRKSATDWTHVGIVRKVNGETFDTLEGNTGGDGGVDGANARSLNRSFADKDFITLF